MAKRYFFILLIVWIYIFSVTIGDDHCSCSQFMSVASTVASEINSAIKNLKNTLEDPTIFANVKTRAFVSKSEKFEKPLDCAEIQEIDPYAKSGVYKIWLRTRFTEGPIDVYCDIEDDGGAWTVIQRRGDFNSSEDYFYRDWEQYKLGFGDLEKDHWIGNDNIFALTNQKSNILKITLSDWEGTSKYAMYDEFRIQDESQNYALHISGYRGTAGDSLSYNNKMSFTTKDKDNDNHSNNCAVERKGAWWHDECTNTNLNGMYLKADQKYRHGMHWYHFMGSAISLKDSIMKIRPKDFEKN